MITPVEGMMAYLDDLGFCSDPNLIDPNTTRYYKSISPWYKDVVAAIQWHKKLCSQCGESSWTFLMEGIKVSGRLSENAMVVLREEDTEAYEVISFLKECSFKMDLEESLLN